MLGIDILQDDEHGPADILLSKGKIVLRGQEIPCIQIGKKSCVRKVAAANLVIVPPQSETLIDVYVERSEADELNANSNFIIEPTEHFKETYPLQMASVLVDINGSVASKVRVLNPFTTAVTIYQESVIAQAERIDQFKATLVEEESPRQKSDNTSIRRTDTSRSREDLIKMPITKLQKTNNTVSDHLKDLFERSTSSRTESEKGELADLLTEFQGSFSKDEWDIGLTHLAEHSINTGNAEPIKQSPRRVPMAYAKEEKKAIEDLLEKGVIRKSTSPWASPIVLVRKKNGTVRPCVDYRRVNSLVKPDGFPLPHIQDCLDAVAGATLFSTFDLTSEYFQIPLKESNIPKSAFVCKFGQFEMMRMPFGLNNSASTFQRTMELVLQGLQWETCLIYIDDIIVFSTDFDEHMSRVRQVFSRLQAAGLKLRPEKCETLQEEVTFLGHVSATGVKPNPVNIAKVIEWPVPKTAKQVKQFVALGSYYRRFVPNFAKIVRPMVELTRKGQEFAWTETCQNSFERLKKLLVGADVMGYPLEGGGSFILDVDASDCGIGGVLQQIQDGRERVIAYASRALNKAERNYCISEKELLAIRYFIEYFRQYLLGRRFIVRSDHQALIWLYSLKEPRGKIARWIEILSHYDFAIEYRPGKKQGHCDALSRCENPKDCDCPYEDMSEPLKCGPCKNCMKRAQDMHHSSLCEDIAAATDKPEALRAVEEPRPGPSAIQGTVGTCQPQLSWAGGRTLKELARLQAADPDIGPIYQAKVQGTKPNTSSMLPQSPATRH